MPTARIDAGQATGGWAGPFAVVEEYCRIRLRRIRTWRTTLFEEVSGLGT
ncbi:hypothetical protein [Nonomuraea sp. KM88]